MGFGINNDRGGLALAEYINLSYLNMQRSLGRLASGRRINSASDGPAQFVISEQLRSQIASLSQEIENTSALLGKYDTASSTVSQLRSDLSGLRSLAVAASNEGVNDEAAQQAYDMAADLMVDSYNDTASNATYNGSKLLDGSEGSLASISQLEGIDLSSAEAAQISIERIDEAINELDTVQAELGAVQKNELESQRSSLQVSLQNLQAAESRLTDTDFAMEFSRFFAERIKFHAGLAMMSHLITNSSSVLGLLESN